MASASRASRRASTAAVVVCLALGTGSVAALLAIVDRVLVHPTVYAASGRLVQVYETFANGYGSVAPATFRGWTAATNGILDLAAYSTDRAAFVGSTTEAVAVTSVTVNGFELLGVAPRLGRGLAARDSDGAEPVAVISDAFWRSALGARPDAIGRVVSLSGRPYTIVGVMPRAFAFPARVHTDIWVPLALTPNQWADREGHYLLVVGRLRPGASAASAHQTLDRVARRLNGTREAGDGPRGVSLVPLDEDLTRPLRPSVLAMLGAAVLVLVIACVNVTMILLAQIRDEEREIALRAALGAAPARLARERGARGIALGASGGAAGLVVALVGLRAVQPLSESVIGIRVGAVTPMVLVFLLLMSIGLGLGLYLLPLAWASRHDLRSALASDREGSRDGPVAGARSRGVLVVLETAVAFSLLVSAGILLQSVRQLLAVPTGMRTDDVVTMRVGASPQGSIDHFYLPVLERVQAIRGVVHAGMISMLPLQESGSNGEFTISPATGADGAERPSAEYRVVSPDYFAALGIPQLSGRAFSTESDLRAAPMVFEVNQALVRRFMGGGDAIGRQIAMPGVGTGMIAGVVGDVHQVALNQAPAPELYIPLAQVPASLPYTTLSLVVRTTLPIARILPEIRAAVRSVDPTQPIADVQTMNAVVDASFVDRDFLLAIIGTFAAIALGLAAAGLFGVVHSIVGQRHREIALRVALGARSRTVIALFAGRIAVWIGCGLVGGLVLAFTLSRVLASQFRIDTASHWPIYLLGGAAMPLVAAIATFLPIRDALGTDPAAVLRES